MFRRLREMIVGIVLGEIVHVFYAEEFTFLVKLVVHLVYKVCRSKDPQGPTFLNYKVRSYTSCAVHFRDI